MKRLRDQIEDQIKGDDWIEQKGLPSKSALMLFVIFGQQRLISQN